MTDPERAPEISVVVISYGPRPTLPDAVRSLLEQDAPSEVVVVHSGGGDAAGLLARAGVPPVPVIAVPERLYPGAARNLGIARTTAPIVAFLADDCRAAPGWLRARVVAHHDGHEAVASALVCHRPRHPTTLGIHLSRYIRRMPRFPAHRALRYGVSYTRSLLERHGEFREDMLGSEDRDYNARFAGSTPIHWDPQIVTIHHGLERLLPALRDQYSRGRLQVRMQRKLGSYDQPRLGTALYRRLRFARRHAPRVVGGEARAVLVLGLPALVLSIAAYTLGEAREGRKR